MSRQRPLSSGLPRVLPDMRTRAAHRYRHDMENILNRYPGASETCPDLLEAYGLAWLALRDTQRLQLEATAQPGQAMQARTLLKRSASALSRMLAVERQIAAACRGRRHRVYR